MANRRRSIPGFPGYRADAAGVIWTCWQRKGLGPGNGSTFVLSSNWKPLKPRRDKYGYLCVRVCVHGRKLLPPIHKLVLLAFEGPKPAPNMQARHKNGIKDDNRPGNLRWGTSLENNHDRIKHGVMPHGEGHKSSKLKEDDVRNILQLASQGVSRTAIGRRYNISIECIRSILAGKTWRRVTGIKPE